MEKLRTATMLNLTGVLVCTYTAPAFEPKDAEKGENKPQKPKVQILGDVALKNGETKKDLITVSVPDLAPYEGKDGSEVTIPVGAFSPSKGNIAFFGL
jgi:hypothetical protein